MASKAIDVETEGNRGPVGQLPGGARQVARRLILTGRVQGLGVRPTIYRLATEMGLGGTVGNTPRGVVIDIEGPEPKVSLFCSELPHKLPAGTILESMESEELAASDRREFIIVHEQIDGPLNARIPPDLGMCRHCLSELNNPSDRRYRYPFISCTLCGPRYSIIRTMPYEREDTTMAQFDFCSPCNEEYRSPPNRRFHAQTNACHDCGPQVWFVENGSGLRVDGAEAIENAVRNLRSGKIIAIRGIGGYQLLVDATDEQAVERLRERKRRRGKPLAVMVESIAAAQQLAVLDETEQKVLADPSNAIVLVRAKPDSPLAKGIHPHLDTVGLMLPTTPLHAMLLHDTDRPLVCTSGNHDGHPLEYLVDRAEKNLTGVCDAWLHHDREIARPIDDSVVRVIAGRPVTIRLARGLAPLALDLPPIEPTLAVGGYQKAATAWSNGKQAILGPHIGDQETLAAREHFLARIEGCKKLYRFQPQQLVHDLHPEYFSTIWAIQQNLPARTVQHHHAHVIAGMLEHGWLDRQVLGVAWDGTGYGTDGTIWGGEFLIATATQFQRYACLRPFQLPGGEVAIHEPWRVAVAILAEVALKKSLAELPCCSSSDIDVSSILQILDRPQFSPRTTSAGRLFDAAAAIVLGLAFAKFEGEPAMRLESIANRSAQGQYEFPIDDGDLQQLDWRPLFSELLEDVKAGINSGTISMRFHRTLAAGIVKVCRLADLPIVLCGGVFQNRLLTELVVEQFADGKRSLGLPGIIPPNDGGIAAGQLAFAAKIGESKTCV